jgi:hypothetical protein
MRDSAHGRVGPAASAWRLWVPRQHGAWAMLAVPLLLGIAATAPSPWHLLLGIAALVWADR